MVHQAHINNKAVGLKSSIMGMLVKMLSIIAVLAFSMHTPKVAAQNGNVLASNLITPKPIWEHVLYQDLKQDGGTYAFYKMTVGARYFTGGQHLVVRVIADSFDSDPDVYISDSN
jgi:hypothetical protein